MFSERNTKTNLPAQIDLYAQKGAEYEFLFMAKGGGSANKTYLYQQTKALLNPKKLEAFLKEKVQTLGTAACPPYHVAMVIGGTSAEMNLKTVKLASARYYDDLPTTGNEHGRAFRDLEWEAKLLKTCQDLGVGAQFGGKYFAHDCRVIRLPRHGASCPVGLGVSCSADRQIIARINEEGVFVEELEQNPARFLPEAADIAASPSDGVVQIDLNQPMKDILASLSQHPIKTRVALTGSLIVARDIAHAKLNDRLEKTGELPDCAAVCPGCQLPDPIVGEGGAHGRRLAKAAHTSGSGKVSAVGELLEAVPNMHHARGDLKKGLRHCVGFAKVPTRPPSLSAPAGLEQVPRGTRRRTVHAQVLGVRAARADAWWSRLARPRGARSRCLPLT